MNFRVYRDFTMPPHIGSLCLCLLMFLFIITEAMANVLPTLNSVGIENVSSYVDKPVAVIDAVEDDFSSIPINGFVGGTTSSVYDNDTIDGAPFADTDVVALIVDNDGLTGVVINPDGTLTVPAGTPASLYAIKYEICEAINNLSCDITVATILVNPPFIQAIVDDFTGTPISGFDGGTTASVYGNDSLNGAPFSNTDVIGSVIDDDGLTGVVFNVDGTITVPPNTPAQIFEVEYQICEANNPSNCSSAIVAIQMFPPSISAADNDFSATPFNGFEGGSTLTSIYDNDTINGMPFAAEAVTATVIDDDGLPGASVNPDGTMFLPSPTPEGTYVVEYQICETINPSNCATAFATLVVFAPVIDAVNDDYTDMPINGIFGGSFENILDNDRLNGLEINPAVVIITPTTIGSIGINSDGTVDVLPGILPGTYTLQYTLCERLNVNNCDTATVTIFVGDCLLFPVNDCDGDGVPNGVEIEDGTDPANPCSLIRESQSVPITDEFRNLDCDGDGVINQDEWVYFLEPCRFVLESQTVPTSEEWNALDCDGDGVVNGTELEDNTNPRMKCEYEVESQTVEPSEEWGALDCDGDGVINSIETIDGTNTKEFCDFVWGNQTTFGSAEWAVFDCDGDGVTNQREKFNDTNPLNPCDYILRNQEVPTSIEWQNLDCDGDGVINETELGDETNPQVLCDFLTASQTVLPSEEWDNLDCDEDSVINVDEIIDETEPLDICSFLPESRTLPNTESWLNADCDVDGIPNGDEIADDNNNGIPDFIEFNIGDEDVEDNLQAYDFLSPNENGLNDVFVIRGLQQYPENELHIYNRWGVLVYETKGYGQNDNFFRGMSSGRVTVEPNAQLPEGTYYYVLIYQNAEGDLREKAGPMYINRK